MAKFYGKIGFTTSIEIEPGIWSDTTITERNYYGDVTRNIARFNYNQESSNSNLNLTNAFSIVADDYAIANEQYMAYVEYRGTKWTIESVEDQYPRLILNVGGVYNGN